jgi:hypothetical protein
MQQIDFKGVSRSLRPEGVNAVRQCLERMMPKDIEEEPGEMDRQIDALEVFKLGAKTRLTKGVVSAVKLYPRPAKRGVSNQRYIIKQKVGDKVFGDKGDSGSIVFDKNGRLVGLFTGLLVETKCFICIPIEQVAGSLGIGFQLLEK